MSFANLAALEAHIADQLDRTDLASQISTFVDLAQGRMYAGNPVAGIKPLRIKPMLATATLSSSSGSATLPAGWLDLLRVRDVAANVGRQLDYLPPADFWERDEAYMTGAPVFYTIEGDALRLAPVSDAVISVSYYGRLTGDPDWIVTNAAHVYLHGALAEAWDFIGLDADNSVGERHRALFWAAVQALNRADMGQTHSGSPLRLIPRVSF